MEPTRDHNSTPRPAGQLPPLVRRALLTALTCLATAPLIAAGLLPNAPEPPPKLLSSAASQNPELALGNAVPRHYVVEATGRDYRWRFRCLEPSEAATSEPAPLADEADGAELRLPVGATVELRLRSDDYVYLFSAPELGIEQIAAPGLVYQAWCTTDRPLQCKLQADTLCNFRLYHDEFMGRITVQ